MGSLYRGTCHATPAGAKAAFCSDSHAVIGSGSSPLVASCLAGDFDADTYTLRVTDGNAATLQTLPFPTFPECNEHADLEAIQAFWPLALTLCVTIVCAKVVLNIFRGRQDVV